MHSSRDCQELKRDVRVATSPEAHRGSKRQHTKQKCSLLHSSPPHLRDSCGSSVVRSTKRTWKGEEFVWGCRFPATHKNQSLNRRLLFCSQQSRLEHLKLVLLSCVYVNRTFYILKEKKIKQVRHTRCDRTLMKRHVGTLSPSYRCVTCRRWGTSGSDSIGICYETSCECDSEDRSDRTPTLTWWCVWRNPKRQIKKGETRYFRYRQDRYPAALSVPFVGTVKRRVCVKASWNNCFLWHNGEISRDKGLCVVNIRWKKFLSFMIRLF